MWGECQAACTPHTDAHDITTNDLLRSSDGLFDELAHYLFAYFMHFLMYLPTYLLTFWSTHLPAHVLS